MKHLYTKLIVSLAALTLLTGFANITSTAQAANYFNMGGTVYECTDASADGYDVDQNKCYSWCFVKETKVTMADGTLKNIEDVIVGDWLKGSVGPNRVEYLIRKFNQGKIYGFNGGKPFVTDSHPFMTTDGWKSIDPEATKLGHPDLEVEKLVVGDILITENGNVELTSIIGVEDPQKVYTFGVNGTHDYYADGFLVHNKYPPNIPCPAGWFSIEDDIYDWSLSSATYGYNCYGRDLGAPVFISSGGGVGIAIDNDIINMVYWDKNSNGSYDTGTDRSLLIPTYAVNASGNYGWLYYTNYYYTGFGWFNNGINLAYIGTYTFGISQSSTPWVNLMNQGLTTNDPIVGSLYAGTGYFSYYTGLNVGLDFTCNGTGSEVLSFSEYSCPAGYVNYGMSCRTGSTVAGGPCVYNTDCTAPGVCAGGGYSPPVTPFRYNDGLAWNASHPHWNDQPHAPSAGDYCREGDEGGDADPDPGTPVPCWYYPGPNGNYCGGAIGGGGCGDFVPMEGTTTYGTCSTSSSSTITATETIVAETVACTGTGGGCVSDRSCSPGFSLTGDTNGNGTPNCTKVSCVTTTGGTTLYEYTYDWTQPGPISVGLQANEDGYSQSCAASFFIVLADIPTALSSDVTVNFDAVGPGGEQCPGQSLTIPGGSTTASTNVACGCAIANGGNLNMTITSISPSFIDGMYFDIGNGQYFLSNTSTGLDISSNIQNCGCDTNGSDNCAQPTITETSNPTSYCYDTVRNFPLVPHYIYKIYGYSGTTMGGGQTICTTENEEATDLNNCSGCGVTTESPTVCDINDPLMAGVCYIPGGFGSTLMIKEGINAALGSPMPMVGINTSDPHEVLDVNGIVRSAQVLTLSDARLKTSIEKIDSALEKIRQINGYSFEWKKDGKPDFGVLAQEIEKIFKNAVDTDIDGLKTVQYTALLAPIVEAIHEINTQIETLSNEKFDAQSKRIEAIEAKIQ